MRIIFLNAWYGQVYKPFMDFIAKRSGDTDIFCLSEIDINLHSQLVSKLNDFNSIESHKNIGPKNNFDISIFTSKKLKINNFKINIINKPELGDCVTVEYEKFVLCGVHGLPRPGDKLDTPDRIQQSKEILDSVAGIGKPRIIGGDFNLMPDTMSVKIFEKNGYRNLIKEFGIKNTRNKLCWDQFPEEVIKHGKQYFADYCFVSPGVSIKSFEVPNVEISDHEPLILDFEV